ncbi:hypothetical protein H0H81_004914 [Sphagnurus paluster]|uniref:Cryptochrome/DNA photolyase FAD-binding domain-containing protein n=1 Tax=Sphagnurus paluster TaxID=117069 RepID=A0A9P7K6U6_9AGAR|nr:hypothetical protein H0H81_004914 [Sphagnurus paluster]
MAGFPRVSMGRPFVEKYANIIWEDYQVPGDSAASEELPDSEALQKWKEGKTGFPIVDATMRCLKEMGWVHNRMRMITAMFLTKDLMIDWKVGEKYFMEQLIDGDLASNNGGWQCQSLKADPTGDFIRHWVPELRKLRGPDLHNPSTASADKLGYPRPMVNHAEARVRALRRYKNPGEE